MSDPKPNPVVAHATVEIGESAVGIDAAIVGRGLGLEPQDVLRLMREGAITGVCEEGIEDDAGFHRVTFFYKGRRLRLTVDGSDRVVRHSLIDFGDRPLSERLRRAGA